jgi:hypothetical protein
MIIKKGCRKGNRERIKVRERERPSLTEDRKTIKMEECDERRREGDGLK